MARIFSGNATKQSDEMSVDDDEVIERDRILQAGTDGSVEQWMRMALKVQDDPSNNRFLVRIGRLLFPVGYNQLANETTIMLEEGADTIGDGSELIELKPTDLKVEKQQAIEAKLQAAREDLKKPLTVRRAILEKGYGPKT